MFNIYLAERRLHERQRDLERTLAHQHQLSEALIGQRQSTTRRLILQRTWRERAADHARTSDADAVWRGTAASPAQQSGARTITQVGDLVYVRIGTGARADRHRPPHVQRASRATLELC